MLIEKRLLGAFFHLRGIKYNKVNMVMTTIWTSPTAVIQYPEAGGETIDTAWDTKNNFQELIHPKLGSLQSQSFLFHSARSPKLDSRNKTYFLQMTGFNFLNLPETLSGIEVKLQARRYGRAYDDVISLCLGGNSIGENHAGTDIFPEIIYGSSTDLWKTNLTINNIQDPTFGVIIRFQSHPSWPHKDSVLIDSVQVRIN